MRTVEEIKTDYTNTCIKLGDLIIQKGRLDAAIKTTTDEANSFQKEFAERVKFDQAVEAEKTKAQPAVAPTSVADPPASEPA